jgi:hypothetical protein
MFYPVTNKKASDQTSFEKAGWTDAVVLPIRRWMGVCSQGIAIDPVRTVLANGVPSV